MLLSQFDYQTFQRIAAMLPEQKAQQTKSKLASLKATLVETTTQSLTGVKCRATSVAKNYETHCNNYSMISLFTSKDGEDT